MAIRPATVLVALVMVACLLGGGSRGDIASLMILRPLSVCILGYAIYTVGFPKIREQPVAAAGLLGLALIHIVHLVPLPPNVWTNLPGRGLIVDNLVAAKLAIDWRPLSLSPFATWNGLFAMAIPLAAWSLSSSMRIGRDLDRLLFIVVILGLLSGVIGILQLVSGYNSSLYFYHVTNNGTAVGLFANRNHNAFFLACIVPIVGYLFSASPASVPKWSRASMKWILIGFLLFATLLTGSRGGLAVFLVALAALPLFSNDAETIPSARRRTFLYVTISAAAVVLAAIIFTPGSTLGRLNETGIDSELRFQIWPVIWSDLATYFPFGAGMGTFVEMYKIVEPSDLMRAAYVNHAHNDWLELVSDAGALGALLLAIGVVGWGIEMVRAVRGRGGNQLRLLGAVVIGLLGLASFVDYPLRTPALAALFAMSAGWIAISRHVDHIRSESGTEQ